MTLFELGMLICFGAAWPLSIYKSWVSRSNKGKSFIFLLVVFIGYIFGIVHKILNNYNYVFYFYIVNAVMVLVDILIYLRNVAFDHPETKKDKIMEIL